MLCEENYFVWDDPLFEPLWALLGEYNPYYVHGYVAPHPVARAPRNG